MGSSSPSVRPFVYSDVCYLQSVNRFKPPMTLVLYMFCFVLKNITSAWFNTSWFHHSRSTGSIPVFAFLFFCFPTHYLLVQMLCPFVSVSTIKLFVYLFCIFPIKKTLWLLFFVRSLQLSK